MKPPITLLARVIAFEGVIQVGEEMGREVDGCPQRAAHRRPPRRALPSFTSSAKP